MDVMEKSVLWSIVWNVFAGCRGLVYSNEVNFMYTVSKDAKEMMCAVSLNLLLSTQKNQAAQ